MHMKLYAKKKKTRENYNNKKKTKKNKKTNKKQDLELNNPQGLICHWIKYPTN